MPPVRGSAPPGIARFVSTAILGIVLLLNGNSFRVRKDIHTPALNTGTIWNVETQSGSTVTPRANIDVSGNLSISGTTLRVNGVDIASLASAALTLAGADARYVNTSGDTMTGSLTINLSSGTLGLNLKQTGSAATLVAAGGKTRFSNTGTTVFNNVNYNWPAKAGSGKFLTTTSGGTLTWAAAGGAGGGADDWDVKNTSTSAGSECGNSNSAEVDCSPNYTIAAGDWSTVGDVYVIEAFGRIRVDTDTLTMQVKIGATDICTFTMSSGGTTNGPEFHVRALLNLRSTGAGGTFSGHCTFNGGSPTGTTLQGDGNESFSVNTTTTNVLQMSADYGGSKAANGMTILNFMVYKISNPS